ncbi:putative ATP-dependent RNA helicase DDX56 [Babesia sp. Xinjiang]|uniref:putative ATP-dependent RNA helicase DDX56 n=1 Tax=Babesia sp. Xinjiang TaxID=462227 RepID=UPI000A251A8C|nr:putative ATP-dependent RNA helicase DDX56 [Babesia sp. Xinjiang]ORM41314.1 putative ATP-dependent RNA helicase DDX56 [Babesia sp. Xinjiang]
MVEAAEKPRDASDGTDGSDGDNDSIVKFGKRNLHPTLLESLAHKYTTFTDIQKKTIPIILAGKDVLIKAQTGSGKTLAALIPVVNYLYESISSISESQVVVLVVVPTTELVTQTIQVLTSLLKNRIAVKAAVDSERIIANVIVSKPQNALYHAREHQSTLKKVVLDEADLLFEFGFKNETLQLAEVLRHFGRLKHFQTILLSATLDQDVQGLANLILYKPVYVEAEFKPTMGSIKEFYVEVEEDDKSLYTYALLKMEALPHPTLIFTNSDERAYMIKTLLAKLSIDARTLSRLLSPRMRQALLTSFNQGSINVLIVADDERGDKLCATRGVDFKSVQCVLNFDAPADVTVYTHRIGRTGRMGNVGSSITFICPGDTTLLEELQADKARNVQQLQVAKGVFESMRYRVDDVAKGVTKRLVTTSQMQALRQSALLEDAFVTTLSKRDEVLLKAVVKNDDKKLTVEKRHLAHIPNYLVNDPLKATVVDLQQKVNVNVRPPVKTQTVQREPSQKQRAKGSKKTFTRKKLPTFKRRKK